MVWKKGGRYMNIIHSTGFWITGLILFSAYFILLLFCIGINNKKIGKRIAKLSVGLMTVAALLIFSFFVSPKENKNSENNLTVNQNEIQNKSMTKNLKKLNQDSFSGKENKDIPTIGIKLIPEA